MEHSSHDSSLEALASLMRGRRTLVLSGAGISTESGIPDYRGPRGTLRARKPMQYREFVGSAEARQRYWARSFVCWARSAVGWNRLTQARPNPAHAALALARLERAGAVTGVITQNVDNLHRAAAIPGWPSLAGLHARKTSMFNRRPATLCQRIAEKRTVRTMPTQISATNRQMAKR